MGLTNLKSTNKLLPLNIQMFAGSVSILEAYETNVNQANNTNDVYTRVRISTSGATWNQEGSAYCNVSCHTPRQIVTNVQYFKIGQNSSVDLGFLTTGLTHNDDGTLAYITVNAYVYLTNSTQPSTSTTIYPSTIPRYANITKFNVQNISGPDGLTKVKYDFSADVNLDWAWYSTDNGSTWHNLPNSNIVSGLSEATSYNFKLKVRRADSGRETTSGTVTKSTYARNKIYSVIYPDGSSSAHNGKELRITATSASGSKNNIRLGVYGGEYSILHEDILDTTFTAEEMDTFLQYTPNSTNLSLIATAETLDNDGNVLYTNTLILNYAVINSDPLFYDFRFLDINPVTQNLTGNNQYCILGYSYMKVLIPAENKAIAQNYATMSKYRYTLTADQTIDREYLENLTVEMLITDNQLETGNPVGAKSGIMTVYAIDSRGKSYPVEKQAERIISYVDLIKTNTGVAQRVDEDGTVTGVSEITKISFEGSMWKGNFGDVENSIKSATYRYKKSSGLDDEWTEVDEQLEITVDENGKFSFSGIIKGDTDLGFDISNVYVIEVTVEDELSKVVYTINLGSGRPHVAYARDGVSIMGKYDEELGGALQVFGQAFSDGQPLPRIYIQEEEPTDVKKGDLWIIP